MGWFGHGLYDGDGTQTLHINYIKLAIPSLDEEEIFDFLQDGATIIPKEYVADFVAGIPRILKKLKTPKKWDEDNAIDWQMLLSLFVDNNLKVPHEVLVNGMLGSFFLLREHCDDFNNPHERRSFIKSFMKTVDEGFCSVKARKELIQKYKKVYHE